MCDLDNCYARLLQVGFVVLRQAFESADTEWLDAELTLLHNIPTLIGETNAERHRYFWFHERDLYIDGLSKREKHEALSRMRTYYEPIWNEMQPLLLLWFNELPLNAID